MTTVKLNLTSVEQAAVSAFQGTCQLLGREFTRTISEVGAFSTHPDSDIVDTGQLRASQQLTFPSPGWAIFSWNTEYALYVHEGYTLRNGGQVQGRPWTQLGQERFEFIETYKKLLEAKLAKRAGTG